ncbi:MAG: hypothetical protein QNJ70_17720 [Xenococcaceae cyanobacterium MO_207.B15]|nr:hypothetical protein [Xenococcaceae cyanobacterium MO_207.B15]
MGSVKIVKSTSANQFKKNTPSLWFERIMAFTATLNLVFVIFDLSYVPLRDFWLNGRVKLGAIRSSYIKTKGIKLDLIPSQLSSFIVQYDDVKGIEPNRTTEGYIAKVEELEQELINNNNWDNPAVTNILEDLRRRSVEMVENDPFAEAGKSGNLERIKNIMREHLPNADNSSKQAFRQFWTVEHLENRWEEESAFFAQEIKPLLATNYYRHIGENGGYVNNFGYIDFPFGAIFFLEFMARTWYISRTRTAVSWRDAMLWRWYDLFFILPLWRWLRVIPVTIRLDQARIISLTSIQKQISQGVVAGIAEDVTEVVIIRLINQIQTSISQGEIGNLVTESNTNSYIDLNNTNETAEIIKILAQTIVYQVLPAIQPEAETLLQYSVEKALQQTSAYQGLLILPGGDRFVSNLTKQLVTQSYEVLSHTLQGVLQEDEQFEKLLDSLLTNISRSFATEIKAQQSLTQIEALLVDFLEEVKVNYVQRLSHEDVELILEQTRNIRNKSY